MTAPTWLTGKADAASLAAIAEALGAEIDPATVDELWLFPTRRAAGIESTVFVFSIHEHEGRRRVVTAHIRAVRNKRGVPTLETKLVEHATAPAEMVPRVIAGVLHRLGDDYASTPPSAARIDCSMARWHALIDILMSVQPNQALPERLLNQESLPEGATKLRAKEALPDSATKLRDKEALPDSATKKRDEEAPNGGTVAMRADKPD